MYLSSGVKLFGHSKSFDKCAPALESEQQEQVIFKHAMVTMTVAQLGGVCGEE
jgi:host factor-I protein